MVKRRGVNYSPKSKKKRLETSRENPGNEERSVLNEGIVNLYKQVLIEKESVKQMKSENMENLKTPTKERRRRNNAPVASLSSITFDDVGGMDETLEKLKLMFIHHRLPPGIVKTSITRGILLHGPPGCGKTLIARALAGQLQLPILEIGSIELENGIPGESEGKIREIFEAAIATGPCILFIDDVQVLCQKSSDNMLVHRMRWQLSKSFDDLVKRDPKGQVMVIGATNQRNSMDCSLCGNERFSCEVEIGIPDISAREKILEVIVKGMQPQPAVSLPWLAKSTPGYVGSDLQILVCLAENIGIKRLMEASDAKKMELDIISEPGNINHTKLNALDRFKKDWWYSLKDTPLELVQNFSYIEEDFKKALKEYIPYALKEGFSAVDDVTWEDVGALTDVKQAVQESIVWPIKYSELFKAYKVTTSKGILLFGPKGCGKTLVAKAIANECNLNFLLINGPELLNKYVGESERAIRNTFKRAQSLAPCVLFFDEFDALCPPRSSTKENAPIDRVVNQLLCVSDGACSRKEVFLVAATNRLDRIDSAMLRPGRLDMIFFVGLPSEDGRVDILRKLIRKHQTKFTDEALENIARDPRCRDFSGADLNALVQTAITVAVKERVEKLEGKDEDQAHIKGYLSHSHFDEALNSVKPSISKKDKKYFEKHSSLCHGGTYNAQHILKSSKNTWKVKKS